LLFCGIGFVGNAAERRIVLLGQGRPIDQVKPPQDFTRILGLLGERIWIIFRIQCGKLLQYRTMNRWIFWARAIVCVR
jgi:hypothetical protein